MVNEKKNKKHKINQKKRQNITVRKNNVQILSSYLHFNFFGSFELLFFFSFPYTLVNFWQVAIFIVFVTQINKHVDLLIL